MYILIMICGIFLGVSLTKTYLYFKKENEISGAKINDVIITKDNKIGILINYYRNFEYANIADNIVYEIRYIYTDNVRKIGKDMIYRVVKRTWEWNYEL